MRAAKVIENPKKSIIMKGRKSSETLNTFMRELHMMRGMSMSQLLMRKTHDVVPMEDVSFVENQSVKYDSSLFAVGSHQKKRPDNVVLGRVYDGHTLDMFEFGIENYQGTAKFKATEHISADLKPILIFQGEQFEVSEKHKRIKNLLIDFFRIQDMKEANIVELKRVMVFTCRGDKEPIEVRHLECDEISEATVKRRTVPFREIGPCFNMRLRRDKMATFEAFKDACKKPKVRNPLKKKSDKNKYTNVFGETKGKVFVQHADIDTIVTRKFKGMRKGDIAAKKHAAKKLEAEDV